MGYACGADNVLMTPAIRSVAPKALIAAADIMVTIHVLGSFQVYSMPVRVCSSLDHRVHGVNPMPLGCPSCIACKGGCMQTPSATSASLLSTTPLCYDNKWWEFLSFCHFSFWPNNRAVCLCLVR